MKQVIEKVLNIRKGELLVTVLMFFYYYSIVFTLSILNCKNRDDDASNITAYHSTGN